MENQTIAQQIQFSKDTANSRYQNAVQQLKFNRDALLTKLVLLESKLPSIIEALDSEGLTLQDLSYYKTGMEDDWSSDTKLCVEFRGVPHNGKVKFLTFNGYTSSGSGKNQARLKEKATKLATSLKDKIGMESVQVNEFSLEVKQQADNKRVLYSIYF